MKGIRLTFHTYESQKLHGLLLYEWLLELARKQGCLGGTAFRGLAGFGKQGILHEDHFFELGSDVPIMVEFILNEQEANLLLDSLRTKKLDIFYTKSEIECARI